MIGLYIGRATVFACEYSKYVYTLQITPYCRLAPDALSGLSLSALPAVTLPHLERVRLI